MGRGSISVLDLGLAGLRVDTSPIEPCRGGRTWAARTTHWRSCGTSSADTVPAMLLFLLWSVVASIYLSITAPRRSQVAPTARVPAHA
jgi:hypothetical protein